MVRMMSSSVRNSEREISAAMMPVSSALAFSRASNTWELVIRLASWSNSKDVIFVGGHRWREWSDGGTNRAAAT